ncbi:MAG: diguanylate cyclase [Chloroflexota bacterium]|nr:diguanylate cyclase [Chloroflexota bacterium]
MSISGAVLWGSGGTLVLATFLINRAPGTVEPVILGVVVVAYVVTTVLVLLRNVLRPWVFPFIVALGSLCITALAYFDGAPASDYALLYLWAALYAFYFFPPSIAFAELGLIALLSGVELALREANNVPVSRWMLVVGTSFVAGAIIQALVSQVRNMADHDGLTGVANRRRLELELHREMVRGGRSDAGVCVAILALDHFKAFNDELGHPEGDKHLRVTAEHWRVELREGDLLARQGGEEFAVVLPDCTLRDATAIADRLRAAVPHGQTASAGVAQWNGQESSASLLGRADAALYEAKVAGRDRTVEAAAAISEAGQADLPQSWAKVLPQVLEQRSIRFGYQPILNLADGALFGYEALARPHGAGIELSVESFFAAAHRMGYGRDLDWLCRRVCLESSREEITQGPLFMNVGVPALLAPVHDVDQMLMLVEYTGWRPQDIVLEITERDLISDLERFQEVLGHYRDEGFRFAIDDVGDGHSTLEVLAAGAPEFVKIARRLTAGASQPGARAAVRAVTAYAASLGSMVIAEGIEDDYQADLMRDLGCHMGQGFALGRPRWRVASAVEEERPALRVVGD